MKKWQHLTTRAISNPTRKKTCFVCHQHILGSNISSHLSSAHGFTRQLARYICQINICQSDFRSCKQQTATFFGYPILLLGFHTFFFAVSLYILFSVVPFYFWASIRSFLRCRYISDHPKNAISSIFCSCKITI